MDHIEQLIQRYCDGECSPEESTAVQRLIETNIQAQTAFHFLNQLDSSFLYLSDSSRDLRIEQIMSVLPERTPKSHLRINTGFIALMGLICGMALTTLGFHYSSNDSSISNLIIMTCVCLAGSALALLASLPGRSPSLGYLRRLLSSSLDLTRFQSLSLRCAAVLLMALAFWTWSNV